MKIALLGYGTIGSGVVEVLSINQDSIARKAGEKIEIKYVLDLRDFPGDPIQSRIVHDFEVIVRDPEIEAVVEAMGGVEPAYRFAKAALTAGKSFATSNKALVAKHGAELMDIARHRGLNFLFEASVGGGIPIIRPLNTSLSADVVEEITGILNGTTNYMLSKMSDFGSDFDEVLKEAQQKGYAEADPTADVEGDDAARKIAILTSIACGEQVNFEEVHKEGITKISSIDIKYAKALHRVIKLLAQSRKCEDGYCAMVAPVMLPKSHPLYNVDDVFNAVFVHGNVLGDGMFYGSGAGKLPTASAVVADVVELARNKGRDVMSSWSETVHSLSDYRKVERRFFLRTTDTKEAVEKAFGNVEYICLPDGPGEIGVLTGVMTEAAYQEKAAALEHVLQMIRVE